MFIFRILCALILCALFSTYGQNESEAEAEDSTGSIKTTRLVRMVVTGERSSSYSVSDRTLLAEDYAGLYSNAGDLLNTVSGVTIHKTGGLGAYSDMSIRGSGSNQVQVYLDGMPLNTASGGAVDLSKIPLNLIRKATVYKTTSPLELGGLNAGGVVELSTEPGTGRKVVTGLAELGSYGYSKGGALLAFSEKHVSHRLSVDFARSQNNYPYIYDPTRYSEDDEEKKEMDNNDYTSASTVYSNRISLDRPDGNHTLASQASFMFSKKGLFNYETPDSNDGFSRDRTYSFLEDYRGKISDNFHLRAKLTGRLRENLFVRKQPYYTGNNRKRLTAFPYTGVFITARNIITDFFMIKTLTGGSWDAYNEEDLWSESSGPLPYSHRLAARGGIEADLNIHDVFSARIRGQINYEIDSTNGVSFEHGDTEVNPDKTSGYLPSAQAEIRYKPVNAFCISFGGSYKNRNPGLNEKFARGSKVFGNPGLKEETRMECELGISYSHEKFNAVLSGYHTKTVDKIKWIMQAQNMFVPKNIETVNGYGIECDITLTPFEWLSFTNGLTYMRNTIESKQSYWDGNDEPLLPRFKERAELRVVFPFIELGHSLLYHSRYYLGVQNIQYIEPEAHLNVFATITGFEKINITYRMENYLDRIDFDPEYNQSIVNPASAGEYCERSPKPGRSHYVVLRLSL